MHASLSDILADIAANAIEARATRIEVFVREVGDRIVLSVRDNGKGMPPEVLARAFDPFYTEPGKHDKRKVGMGLPFVRQTCEACGGEVNLESAVGIGTTLTCTFQRDSIDLPPMGDLPNTVLSLFNYPGEFDLLFRRQRDDADYEIARSELAEAVGGFTSVEALGLAREFLVSQEEALPAKTKK